MQTIRWYRLLAVGVLAVPAAGRAQGPQPVIKPVATLVGVDVDDMVHMPNGHVLIYGAGDSISAYDVTTKQTRLIARGWDYELAIAPQGNRIAYARLSEHGDSDFIWSLPIDQKTGAASGPAQRISLSPGDSPSFSPDGKFVAFDGERGTDLRLGDLRVVPATGGPERILAKYEHGIGETYWSTDGKSIFVDLFDSVDSTQTIDRVPVAGGRSERVLMIPHPRSTDGSIAGNIAFYRSNQASMAQGRMAYVTRSGTHGEFSLPPGSTVATSLGVPQPLVVNVTKPTATHILDLSSGRIITPFATDVDGNQFRWSQDSRYIALQAGDSSHREIVVTNGDGSAPRRYAVAHLSGGMQWAPDGKTIAFHADSGRTVGLLDVASGQSHILLSVPRPRFAGGLHWRSDGQAILLNEGIAATLQAPAHLVISELRLDGTTRVVKDVSGATGGGGMIDDQTVQTRSKDGNGWTIVVAGLAGGTGRTIRIPADTSIRRMRVGVTGLGGGVGPTGSPAWYAVDYRAGNATPDLLRVFPLSGQPERQVALPFEFLAADVKLLPDGNHAVVLGRRADNGAPRFFLVPFDGSAPRSYGPNPGERDRSNSNTYLSPDGRFLGFTTQGSPTSYIYDIDLTPILRAAGVH